MCKFDQQSQIMQSKNGKNKLERDAFALMCINVSDNQIEIVLTLSLCEHLITM